jgi:hypothetical protein
MHRRARGCTHERQKDLVQIAVHCQAFVNAVMNLRVGSIKVGNFLAIWVVVRLS